MTDRWPVRPDPETSHLVAEHVSLMQAGDPDAADCSGDVLRLLERLRSHMLVGPIVHASRDGNRATSDDLYVGRFQVLRHLGSGGHGIVFHARDPVLNRDVALKVPSPFGLSSLELRERFLREGQAAAQLEHPHLVPVHEVGEVGVMCYLVMALCTGPTLAEWLRERRDAVPFKLAARLVAQLADAVAHVHQHGILHRDIKPGNVLLEPRRADPSCIGSAAGPEDELTGSFAFDPRLTDFGLAHLCATSDLTLTGQVMGTRAYMAPEQFHGDSRSLGPPTDIYSLGCVLYELLAGRPPAGRGPGDSTELTAPAPLRRLRAGVPRDLQAVCEKCLEADSRHRYQSASDLKADLERFLDGRPVCARAIGPLGRATRWSRRRPAIAVLSGTLLVALAVGSVGITWNRRVADANVREAERNRIQAEKNLRQAHAAVRTFSELLSQADGYDDPEDELRRSEMLSVAVDYYREIRNQVPRDFGLEDDFADALIELADLADVRGDSQEAIRILRELLTVRERIAGQDPSAERRRALAEVQSQLGRLLFVEGELDEALRLHQQALTTCRKLRDEFGMAEELHFMANVLKRQHRIEEARRCQVESVALWDTLVTRRPMAPGTRFNRTEARYKLAQIEWHLGNAGPAISECEAAVSGFRILYGETRNPDVRRGIAIGLHLLAAIHASCNRPHKALENYNLAATELDELVDSYPGVAAFQVTQAANNLNRARIAAEIGDRDRAIAWLKSARRNYQQLFDEYPGAISYRTELGHVLIELAELQRANRRYIKALNTLHSARAAVVEIDCDSPRRRNCHRKIARAYDQLRRDFQKEGNDQLALACTQATEAFELK